MLGISALLIPVFGILKELKKDKIELSINFEKMCQYS